MEYKKQAYTSSNQSFVNSSALQIRLETGRQLQLIKEFLSGEIETLQETKSGELVRVTQKYGHPKANNNGIQSIVNRVSLLLNPSVVQGNYTEDQYNREVSQIRRSLRDELMINLNDWGMVLEDYEGVIDSIMSMIKAFMSRLINNKERESYDATIRHIERDSQVVGKHDKGLI